jgi:hypothetical protein
MIEPFVLIGLAWGAAQVLAYRWLGSSTSFEPTIELFASSYISKRITIVAVGILVIILILKVRPRSTDDTSNRIAMYWQTHRRSIAYRGVGIALVVAAIAVGISIYSPNRVSHITVRFMSLDSDVRPEALAYLIYELNRQQRHWYFNVDFDPLNNNELTSEQLKCEADRRAQLCYATALSDGQPFIGITKDSLGIAYFAESRDGVSVISTAERAYEPISTYEYLVYCLILQSIVIHLDLYGGGLPQGAFSVQQVSHGGLLQFIPERDALKSSILAARLSPDEEALLLNTFGPDYVAICANLLTMDWLFSERVSNNLREVFDVQLGR